MTALSPARGFMRAQDYVELHALASTQGVAVHPIADDITAGITDKAMTFSRPGGFAVDRGRERTRAGRAGCAR